MLVCRKLSSLLPKIKLLALLVLRLLLFLALLLAFLLFLGKHFIYFVSCILVGFALLLIIILLSLICLSLIMTRVFDIQELDRVEFLTMFCSNSKGALLRFGASIRDGKDVLSIHVNKAESVDLGTLSSEFQQFIHYLCAYVYTGSCSVSDLNLIASDTIF